MLPYGVPFDSLSFLYLTSGHFFDFKNLLGLSHFLIQKKHKCHRSVGGSVGHYFFVFAYVLLGLVNL